MTSRLIVTDDATYEQRPAGTSNGGAQLTEYRRPETGTGTRLRRRATEWALLDPEQAEPRAGDRWLLRVSHGKYILTGTVTDVIGDLA